jgi:hypothetical protein
MQPLCEKRVTSGGRGSAGRSRAPTLFRDDPAGRFLSDSSCREATSPGGSGLQVVAAFPKPVEDFGVAGGEGHLEVSSRFRGAQIKDDINQSGSGSDGQVAGRDMEVGMDRWTVSSGVDGGFGQDLAVVGQGDVLRCAGHVGFSRAVGSTAGWKAANKPRLHAHMGGL